jgi:sugar phosphate isomerase/epimerase
MKLAVAIADDNAMPNAFVVWRGIEKSINKAAKLGYDGVELALKQAEEVDREKLFRCLEKAGIEVSCISTGQVFAALGLVFTDPDNENRQRVKSVFTNIIDLAEQFGQIVNIGRVRGSIGKVPKEQAESLFIDMARRLCDYAAKKSVTMVLEPVNRYEIDFINSVGQGVELMKKVDRPNMKLMPDVFHMNIEDRTIGDELAENIDYIRYIHLADSNRLAPGQGHTDFNDIFDNLKKAKYDGWVSVEILPKPDPDTAAAQAVKFLRPLIDKYNQE